jgi:NAD(P)-dependent dehydrogenase (short-subunit alcohol dehydrogenase family)
MTVRSVLFLCFCTIALSSKIGAAGAELTGGAAKQQVVLVTGASSGIGRKITEKLAANGYFVFAGARKQQDLDALNAIENVQSIRLDVTVQEEIDAAVETVRAEGRGLHGLVNNAGVLITGPSTEVRIDKVQWLFEVNVFGVYRVTQAFAPLIIESRGRIVNMGSIAGNIGIEFLAAYSMTKHAIEAYTDALAVEMQRFGVYVTVIAPGDYASKIWTGDIERARQAEVLDDGSPYAEDYQAWIDAVASMELKEPDEVADTVLKVISEDAPSRRYLVVPNEGEMAWVTGSAVERLAELNANSAYSYSKEALTEMLHRAMAEQDPQIK